MISFDLTAAWRTIRAWDWEGIYIVVFWTVALFVGAALWTALT